MNGSILDKLRAVVRELEVDGLTRAQVAERAGVDKGTLSKFMTGRHVPNLLTAVKLAGAARRRLELVSVENSQP